VYEYQDKIIEIRNIIEKELVKVHVSAKFAWDNGATEKQMEPVLQLIRQAQWRWDFIGSSHGASFHAPVESQRILSHSLDKTHQAMFALQKVLFALGKSEVPMPDISTKDKAQIYIGLDMKDINAKKEVFKKTMIPEWIKSARDKKKLISDEGQI
jgi:nitrite reductase (cytochrome c-552)